MEKRAVQLPRGDTIEVTPGVLDANAQYVFSAGHCHSLALAAARALNAKVVVVGRDNAASMSTGDVYEPMHVLVQLADGRWADARGIYDDVQAYTERFRREVPFKVPAKALIVDPDELAPILAASPYTWTPEDPLLAASFIEPLLAEWGITAPSAAIDSASPSQTL